MSCISRQRQALDLTWNFVYDVTCQTFLRSVYCSNSFPQAGLRMRSFSVAEDSTLQHLIEYKRKSSQDVPYSQQYNVDTKGLGDR